MFLFVLFFCYFVYFMCKKGFSVIFDLYLEICDFFFTFFGEKLVDSLLLSVT